jgi:hypothetical protein
MNQRSLSLPYILKRPNELVGLPIRENISFQPDGLNLIKDLRATTFESANRVFRRDMGEGRKFAPNVDSTTRSYELIKKLYFKQDGDYADRAEAIDIISWQIGIYYYTKLISRLKNIANKNMAAT